MTTESDWRAEFLKLCGPGLLAGITVGTWIRLLRERGRTMEAGRYLRAFSITTQSLKNSFWSRLERQRFDSRVREVSVRPPLFILGHWRNGTTHLHHLLAQDHRFGFPNGYQVSFPHTFLSTEKFGSRLLSGFIPRHRPMDNMEMRLANPQEDEFALCASSLQSPCMSWIFPRQKRDFEKYLTLESLSAEELAEWRESFLWFLKKVQFVCDRPLLLKSPPHTARIRLLLGLFPQARFVHIHRNPYRTIQSSIRTFRIIQDWHGLQRPVCEDLEDWAIRQFVALYEAFFDQKHLIPEGHFHEMSFEALEKDPETEMQGLYAALKLPDFQAAVPALRRYLQSVADYQKTSLAELSRELKEWIARDCRRCFEEWGYPT